MNQAAVTDTFSSSSYPLPMKVHSAYSTSGFYTELLVVDRPKDDEMREKKQKMAKDTGVVGAQQTWVETQREEDCALIFDKHTDECRCVDMHKLRGLMRGISVADILENVEKCSPVTDPLPLSGELGILDGIKALAKRPQTGYAAPLVAEDGKTLLGIVALPDLLAFFMAMPRPSFLDELTMQGQDLFEARLKDLKINASAHPIITKTDSIDELMGHFVERKKCAIIKEGEEVKYMVAQYALLCFLQSNVNLDWFPNILRSEIIPLYMIVPRVICVTKKTRMNEVFRILIANKIASVAYITRKNRLKTEITAEHLQFMTRMHIRLMYMTVGEFYKMFKNEIAKPVTCVPDIKLNKLLELFVKNRCTRVWAVSGNRLVGLITATSVIRSLYGARGEDQKLLNAPVPTLSRWGSFFQRGEVQQQQAQQQQQGQQA